MAKLKWFSGGKERREEAIRIIEELLLDLQTNDSATSVKKTLTHYLNEFKTNGTSFPFLMNCMSLELTDSVLQSNIHFTPEQSEKLKELRKLMEIRIF
ncbi:bacteriocin immunity protein [Streptococcus lutetiensis]|uniref:bacteriocin immunity protein n=1 Tax=Streptococcus lutetiensis TaxID=150055 RepID=UPI002284EE7D|nr:bacteriocin immunity protein [Streptococcus lutetiensis]MCY7161470.1 bacteriocin immunity protein [Streptococcus lutetiensis]